MLGTNAFKAAKALIGRITHLVAKEQEATTEVVLGLGELESRSYHLEAGYNSLFAFCTIELGYSEPAAVRRIKAARCVRRFPEVGEMLKRRKLNLTTICALSDVLEPENVEKLLSEAAGKSKAEVNRLVARYRPECNYDLHDRIQPIFVRSSDNNQEELPVGGKSTVEVELEQKFGKHLLQEGDLEEKVRFTFASSIEFSDKVKRMRRLLSGKYRRGARLEDVFVEAMDCYIRHNCPVEKARIRIKKKAAKRGKSGKKDSRHIPADTYLQVYLRDEGRCTYVSPDGRRCGSCFGVEMDHIVPFAKGGSHDPENLRLLCKNHNRLAAEKEFGNEHMQQFRRVA